MGDKLGPNSCRGVARFLLQIDEAEIVAHEADDPNAFIDFFDSQALTREDRGAVDAAASGDENVSIVQGVREFWQSVAGMQPGRIDLGRALHIGGGTRRFRR
jgi:hypothetical protein